MIATFNRVRDDKLPKLDGILPVILFVFTSRFTSFVSNPNDEGKLLTRLFEPSPKKVRLVSDPRDDGMDPTRPDDTIDILVTTPFTASHVTPLHRDGLALHTPGEAVPPTHFQLDVDADDIAAATSHITVSTDITLKGDGVGFEDDADGNSYSDDDGKYKDY